MLMSDAPASCAHRSCACHFSNTSAVQGTVPALVTGQPVPPWQLPPGNHPAPPQQHANSYAPAAQGLQRDQAAVPPAACPPATTQQPLPPQILPPAHVESWCPGHETPPQPVVVEGRPAAAPLVPAQEHAHPPADGPHAHAAAEPCVTEQAAADGAPPGDTVQALSVASTTASTVPPT